MDASQLPEGGLLVGKAVIMITFQILPLLMAPVAVVNSGRIARWCLDRQSGKGSAEQAAPEVQMKLQNFLDRKRLATCKSLVDYISVVSFAYSFFVWLKAIQFGLDSIPVFDVSIIPATIAWSLFASVFQANLLPEGRWTVVSLAVGYNIYLLYIQLSIYMLGMGDRESLIIIIRLFAGFFFCDHRKAAFMQVLFIMIQAPTPDFRGVGSDGTNVWWDKILWEMMRQSMIVGPMWLMWYVVEYFVLQFSELIVQKADVNASLTAARAVLSSQCDAEAILRDDLTFQNPSLKAAHFFGMGVDQLQNRCFLDFLSPMDKDRFQQFVSASVKQLEQSMPMSALSLSVTLELSAARCREVRVYLGSIPDEFNSQGGPCHLMAMNQVREEQPSSDDGDKVDVSPEGADIAGKAREHKESDESLEPPQQAVAAEKGAEASSGEGQVRLNADTLAFHAWSYVSEPPTGSLKSIDVTFDPHTLELETILMCFNPGRQKAKTSLQECVVPGVWPEVADWLKSAAIQSRSAVAPAIIPFVFPKLISSVLASRASELKQLRAPDGSKTSLMLSLSDIRLRHLPKLGAAGGFSRMRRPMGRGTASSVSRTSLGD